ncbi:MAG: DUF6252 family protein [Bacteroidota bacterium]
MKKLLILSIPAALLWCTACKKSSSLASGTSVQQNNNADSFVTLTAKINGTSWKADSVYAYSVRSSANDSGVVSLMITAVKKNSGTPQTLILNITNYRAPLTYPINPPVNTATYYIGNARHYATTGEIVVTSRVDRSLKGTFHFTADSISVESGEFNVYLP